MLNSPIADQSVAASCSFSSKEIIARLWSNLGLLLFGCLECYLIFNIYQEQGGCGLLGLVH